MRVLTDSLAMKLTHRVPESVMRAGLEHVRAVCNLQRHLRVLLDEKNRGASLVKAS